MVDDPNALTASIQYMNVSPTVASPTAPDALRGLSSSLTRQRAQSRLGMVDAPLVGPRKRAAAPGMAEDDTPSMAAPSAPQEDLEDSVGDRVKKMTKGPFSVSSGTFAPGGLGVQKGTFMTGGFGAPQGTFMPSGSSQQAAPELRRQALMDIMAEQLQAYGMP